jgi:hypothetical protein
VTRGAQKCRRKFLRFFPGGFADETYLEWERNYKVDAHARWTAELDRKTFCRLLTSGDFSEVAARAIRVESRTNLLFSFEKMALRDAVKTPSGARLLTEQLYEFLYGSTGLEDRFEQWCQAVASLPRRQARVLTWPIVTVFGFIAQPDRHTFLKPNVTRVAAAEYGFELQYRSCPNWATYARLLEFSAMIASEVTDLEPRDMIDLQSFIWVQGSEEYRGRAFRPMKTTRLR